MDEEQDQLASDFAINYLAKRGMKEEDILDEEGQLSPEIRDHIIGLMDQDGDRSAFLNEYKTDPEGKINSVIEIEDQMQSAKQGAKLKKLSKLQEYKNGRTMKKQKCSCGCEMVDKKERGGKMVSKCSCGCKDIQKGAGGLKFAVNIPGPEVMREVPGFGMMTFPNPAYAPNKPNYPGFITPGGSTTISTTPNQTKPTYMKLNVGDYSYPDIMSRNYTSLIPSENTQYTSAIVPATNLAKVATATGAKTEKSEVRQPNTSISIVDYLNANKQASSLPARKLLAESFGMKDYKGTDKENLRLIDLLRNKKTSTEMGRPEYVYISAPTSATPRLMTSGSPRLAPTVTPTVVPLPLNTQRFTLNANEGDWQNLKNGGKVEETKPNYLELLKNGKDSKNLNLKKKKIKK